MSKLFHPLIKIIKGTESSTPLPTPSETTRPREIDVELKPGAMRHYKINNINSSIKGGDKSQSGNKEKSKPGKD